MPSPIFTDILNQATAASIDKSSKASSVWFRKKAQEFTKINQTQFMRDSSDRYRTVMNPGDMYCFYYDPKHKATLPFYDLFPMIFPLDIQRDYILGINFHYLPPTLRGKLLDALYKYTSNDKLDSKTKMKITYGILKNAAEFPLVKPCIKKYLKGHIRSRFVKIDPSEWNLALFLNLDKFQKAGRGQVWKNSRDIVNGVKK